MKRCEIFGFLAEAAGVAVYLLLLFALAALSAR